MKRSGRGWQGDRDREVDWDREKASVKEDAEVHGKTPHIIRQYSKHLTGCFCNLLNQGISGCVLIFAKNTYALTLILCNNGTIWNHKNITLFARVWSAPGFIYLSLEKITQLVRARVLKAFAKGPPPLPPLFFFLFSFVVVVERLSYLLFWLHLLAFHNEVSWLHVLAFHNKVSWLHLLLHDKVSFTLFFFSLCKHIVLYRLWSSKIIDSVHWDTLNLMRTQPPSVILIVNDN